MNRATQILAMTPEQRTRVALRIFYRFYRRRGQPRGAATLELARVKHLRLSAAFAVMEASDWKADPIRLARNAVAA